MLEVITIIPKRQFMIINKVIEVGLDIQNTINLYNDDDNIKRILSDKYEKKCFKGCYIQSINHIIKVGDCVINQDGVPNFGAISVIFEVTAIVYANGEIINGCTVVNKDKSGMIICSTDIASIIVKMHKSLESITKGQIISLRVWAVRYNQGAEKMSISAVPYLFQPKSQIYKIGNVTNKSTEIVHNVLERIEFEVQEMEKIKKENVRAWETFDQLLYAYKTEQPNPPGSISQDLLALAKGELKNIGYVNRDNRMKLSKNLVYCYAEDKFPENAIIESELSTENVLLILLEDYCAHLRTIREMVGIYNTTELINSHHNLWQILKKNKM